MVPRRFVWRSDRNKNGATAIQLCNYPNYLVQGFDRTRTKGPKSGLIRANSRGFEWTIV